MLEIFVMAVNKFRLVYITFPFLSDTKLQTPTRQGSKIVNKYGIWKFQLLHDISLELALLITFYSLCSLFKHHAAFYVLPSVNVSLRKSYHIRLSSATFYLR